MPTFAISSLYPVDLAGTVTAHGWVKLAPFEWDGRRGVLRRVELLEGGRRPIAVRQERQKEITVEFSGRLSAEGVELATKRVSRWLMLEWNPREAILAADSIDRDIAEFIRRGGGRFLRGSTFYEDLYKTICTINTSWRMSVRMAQALAHHVGQGAAVTPRSVAALGAERLRSCTPLGYRAQVLWSATVALLDDRVIDEVGNARAPSVDRDLLSRLKGLGPYSVEHLRILQCDFSRIPIDSEVRAYCRQTLEIERGINDTFAEWGAFRFLGYKLGRIKRRENWIGDPS